MDRFDALTDGLKQGAPGDEFAMSFNFGEVTLVITVKKVANGFFLSAYNASNDGKWVTGDLYEHKNPLRAALAEAVGDAVAEHLRKTTLFE
ncbi:hypothetical protein C441_04254 [Haloferax sulfurifontis ATCC BAA-897]|nr:hypothetical protein C441_04254 [Haloferax sulfurifontis ATCC BAA-897]